MRRKEQRTLLGIVVIVGFIAILAMAAPYQSISSSLTGNAVKGAIATLCRDGDGSNPLTNDVVNVYYGTRFPDQCYTDRSTTQNPVNTGRYLREYVCQSNDVFYEIYDCGSNNCQYGACATVKYRLLQQS